MRPLTSVKERTTIGPRFCVTTKVTKTDPKRSWQWRGEAHFSPLAPKGARQGWPSLGPQNPALFAGDRFNRSFVQALGWPKGSR
jgi:hypothetical protein